MYQLILFLFTSILLTNSMQSGILVEAALVNHATEKVIAIKINVTNNTDKTIRVLQQRRHDFIREKIRAAGNYIIRIEKWEYDKYELFPPSADIDPVYRNENYITVQKGHSISDTLFIPGHSFSRAAVNRGFPAGQYRLKACFNANEWSDSEENSSEWVSFTIE